MTRFSVVFATILAIFFSQVTLGGMHTLKETGLPLNKLVPEISVIDSQGKKQTIEQLSGEKGLILVFFRSADWCPYCKKHLIEINEWNDKLNSIGYGIAAISYDSVETLTKFSEMKNIKYPLLADQQHETMKTLNVLNQDYKPDSKKYGIPYPGVMVMDNAGKLVYKYFYEGYKDRVKLDELYGDLSK